MFGTDLPIIQAPMAGVQASVLWFGHGFRSDATATSLIEKAIGCRTVALRLTDPRFYHLDTCLCPLDGGWLLYYPPPWMGSRRRKFARSYQREKPARGWGGRRLRLCLQRSEPRPARDPQPCLRGALGMLRRAEFTPILDAAVSVPEIGRCGQVPDAQADRVTMRGPIFPSRQLIAVPRADAAGHVRRP